MTVDRESTAAPNAKEHPDVHDDNKEEDEDEGNEGNDDNGANDDNDDNGDDNDDTDDNDDNDNHRHIIMLIINYDICLIIDTPAFTHGYPAYWYRKKHSATPRFFEVCV